MSLHIIFYALACFRGKKGKIQDTKQVLFNAKKILVS